MNTNQPPDQKPIPALWNPGMAASWSVLAHPAFGPYICALNAKTLGRLDEAKSHMKWFYGTLIYQGILLLAALSPNNSNKNPILPCMLALIVWYFILGRKQVKFVKETYGDAYQKKSWGKPLLIGFACVIGLLIVSEVLKGIAGPVIGSEGN